MYKVPKDKLLLKRGVPGAGCIPTHCFEIVSGGCWLLWLASDRRVAVGMGIPTRVRNFT